MKIAEERIEDFVESTISMLDEMSTFTFTGKYARYNEAAGRRELWEETVDRVLNMHLEKYAFLKKSDLKEIKKAFDYVKKKSISPSMRSMQFGGGAIFAHNPRMYNCAAGHIDSIRSFAEVFYLLLCGTGVTIGLKRKYLNRLPNLVVPSDKNGVVLNFVVHDTIEGWADSVEALLMCYFRNTPFTGRKIVFDYSKIRDRGVPLKTGGGVAPGYKGLQGAHKKIKNLLDHIIEIKGQSRIKSIDAYDIVMHTADAVLSGGIRRAATAAIFDIDDKDMIAAKTNFKVDHKSKFSLDKRGKNYAGSVEVDGREYKVEFTKGDKHDMYAYKELSKNKTIPWHKIHPQRARSNNSVLVPRNAIDKETFLKIFERTRQWGEPGFVFASHEDQLFNPCFEVGFIPVTDDGRCGFQFCNLTSINGAKVETLDDFLEGAWAATVIGTLQAGYTHFPYLSNSAKEITEEEALLGVSITGFMDNPKILLNARNQYLAAQYVKKINNEWAQKIGINPAARTTLVKPEGTNSIVMKSASGIHPHHAKPRYFRRIQMNKLDSVYKFFKKHNSHMCEESVWSATKSDDVITWPIQVSDNVMAKDDLTALKHLNMIKDTQQNWVVPGTSDINKKNVSHNVSCTVVVDENEWEEVADYLYTNRDFFAAVSLISKTGDKEYQQPPLEKVLDEDLDKWNGIVENYVAVPWGDFLEKEDNTKVQDTVACAGGLCDTDYEIAEETK